MPPGRIKSLQKGWKSTGVVLSAGMSAILAGCGGNVDPVVRAEQVRPGLSACNLSPSLDKSTWVVTSSCGIQGEWGPLKSCTDCSLYTLKVARATKTAKLGSYVGLCVQLNLAEGSESAGGLELTLNQASNSAATDSTLGTLAPFGMPLSGFDFTVDRDPDIQRPPDPELSFPPALDPAPQPVWGYQQILFNTSSNGTSSTEWTQAQGILFTVAGATAGYAFCVGNLRALYGSPEPGST
jgi:hypothetical protein